MLSFYYIAPSLDRPKNGEGLEPAAAFNQVAYEVLLQIGLIERRYNFFMDCRWDSKYIERKIRYFEFFLEDDSHPETQRFIAMIRAAANKGCELIAYAK